MAAIKKVWICRNADFLISLKANRLFHEEDATHCSNVSKTETINSLETKHARLRAGF